MFNKLFFLALMASSICGIAKANTAGNNAHLKLKPPIGVRPCCAFGYDLKAQLAGVPVPFFSIHNVIDPNKLGRHHYNDGSQAVVNNLLGLGDEQNGLIFTERAGFIDTAHVQDTADFTYFLFMQNQANLGRDASIELPAELRRREIIWYAQPQMLTPEQRVDFSLKAAGLIAYQLAQWHEIAQWFGLIVVGGFDELASAFSPEDLYSNMLGAVIAQEILAEQPTLDQYQFAALFDQKFAQKLQWLGAQSEQVTKQKLKQLEGKWWHSKRRLPNKWFLLKRNYQLRYQLKPTVLAFELQQMQSQPTDAYYLQLPTTFANGDLISRWVKLALVAPEHPLAEFEGLPASLTALKTWHVEQFQALANFAYNQDVQHHPDGLEPQIQY